MALPISTPQKPFYCRHYISPGYSERALEPDILPQKPSKINTSELEIGPNHVWDAFYAEGDDSQPFATINGNVFYHGGWMPRDSSAEPRVRQWHPEDFIYLSNDRTLETRRGTGADKMLMDNVEIWAGSQGIGRLRIDAVREIEKEWLESLGYKCAKSRTQPGTGMVYEMEKVLPRVKEPLPKKKQKKEKQKKQEKKKNQKEKKKSSLGNFFDV